MQGITGSEQDCPSQPGWQTHVRYRQSPWPEQLLGQVGRTFRQSGVAEHMSRPQKKLPGQMLPAGQVSFPLRQTPPPHEYCPGQSVPRGQVSAKFVHMLLGQSSGFWTQDAVSWHKVSPRQQSSWVFWPNLQNNLLQPAWVGLFAQNEAIGSQKDGFRDGHESVACRQRSNGNGQSEEQK